jgi:hypothetical protein
MEEKYILVTFQDGKQKKFITKYHKDTTENIDDRIKEECEKLEGYKSHRYFDY